ncbi:MAG: ABC transporter ATP-binding protein [Granulosicoccus sp.]
MIAPTNSSSSPPGESSAFPKNHLLSVEELCVEIPLRRAVLKPVDGVSFQINAGEIVGVVGESGAGKSITGAAIIGLLERPAIVSSGCISLLGQRIDNISIQELRKIRGGKIGTIFQDPLTSLNPLQRIGDQLVETALAHLPITRAEARARALSALEDVGIPGAAQRMKAYPHEFSGGMRQRVVIALALIGEPSLVIADEPTTALDVSVQAQILMLLKDLCKQRGMGVMLITHDMGVIAETTDKVVVLYAGRVAEIGQTQQVMQAPMHPYTNGLMGATPSATRALGERLQQIPGSMPSLQNKPAGCAFAPRCDHEMPECTRDRPPLISNNDHRVACYLHNVAVSSDLEWQALKGKVP